MTLTNEDQPRPGMSGTIQPLSAESIASWDDLSLGEEHEIAVVGSGPGASMTACLLSEAGHDVIVLEEGLFWPREEISPFSREEMLHKYRNGGLTPAFGKPAVSYVEGRCLGGGSEVNSGLYHRLPEEVRLNWNSRYFLESLTASSLEEQAASVERDIHVSPLPGPAPLPSLLLAQGAEILGWKCPEAPRWHCYDVPEPAGERQTMTRTYLARALAAGARLVTKARVANLARERQGWRLEVTSDHPGNGRKIVRSKTIFLGAGAVGTPVLLQRSRLGKNSGRFLHMHPTVKVVALFPDVVNSSDMGVPVHQVKEFGQNMSLGCSISNPHYLSAAMLGRPGGLEIVRDEWQRMAVYYVMIVPEGSGRVRTLPGFADPLVTVSLTRRDMGMLALGLKRLGTVLFAAGAKRLYPTVAGLGPFTSAKELEGIPQVLPRVGTALMTVHLTSSSAMSGDPEYGVTGQWGTVHGEKNLYVADAGLLCTAPGVNPQGAILTLVRRNVLNWLEQKRL